LTWWYSNTTTTTTPNSQSNNASNFIFYPFKKGWLTSLEKGDALFKNLGAYIFKKLEPILQVQ
jgi:hypothetical protein